MNKKELIKQFEDMPYVSVSQMGKKSFIDMIEQLDEPQPLKLKDIISRMKQLFPNNRTEWIDEILKEFGEEFGSMKFKAGYEKGKFESGLAGIERAWNKPVVPQFVADWYEENKDDFKTKLFRAIDLIPSDYEEDDFSEFEEWLVDERTAPFQTLVNMHQFGYEVKKEKRYEVKITASDQYLVRVTDENFLGFLQSRLRSKFTLKELEQAGFGWVFDCPGMEVEEVE